MTRKEFREMLNREFPEPTHRHNRFHQRTRAYGDYLWHQDREKFEHDYAEHLATLARPLTPEETAQ